MSGPPPDDLKYWAKNELVREVRRLRAILYEHAERRGDDPRPASSTGAVVDVAGDPHAAGGAVLDARAAVLMEAVEVVLVDTKQQDGPVNMMLVLGGRVNYAEDRVEHAYLFGPDGAAGLVSELVGLASRAAGAGGHGERFAAQFQADLDRRMKELP